MMHPVIPPVLTVNDIRREAMRCFSAGESLMLAIEERNRSFHLATAARDVLLVGNALGYVLSHEHPVRGERVMQRMELEINSIVPKHYSDIAARAAEADMWKARALAAEAGRKTLSDQLADLEAEVLSLRSRRTAA